MKARGTAPLPEHWVIRALVLYSLALPFWLLLSQVPLTQEDGFYYFTIARHLAQGEGSTFDGLHLTNGYHPLWLFCLIPFFWITHNPHTILLLGTGLQAIFSAVGTALLYQITRRFVGQAAAALAALLWLLLVHRVAWGGLEFSLHTLGLFTTAWLYLEHFASSPPRQLRPFLLLGGLLALTFLARLDSLLLAVGLGCFLLKAECSREHMKRLLAFITPIAGIVSLYFLSNLWFFHHLFPVSSFVKRSWSLSLLAADPVYQHQGWLAAKAAQLYWPLENLSPVFSFSLFTGLLALSGGKLLGRGGSRMVEELTPFLLVALVQLLAYVSLYHGGLSFPPWYYVIQPWLTVTVVAWLFNQGWALRERLAGMYRKAFVALLLLVWTLVPWYTLSQLNQLRLREQAGLAREPLRDAARWANQHLPEDARVGSWNAGAIGYWSGRQVINLDGLVNSWDYVQTERHDLCRYWQKTQITHLVDVFERGQALSVLPTLDTYQGCRHQMELIWSDDRYQTAWRMEAYELRLSEQGTPYRQLLGHTAK